MNLLVACRISFSKSFRDSTDVILRFFPNAGGTGKAPLATLILVVAIVRGDSVHAAKIHFR